MDLTFFFSEQANDFERENFLREMNARGVTAQDLVNFVHLLLPKDFPAFPGALDVCGTGGSGLARLNVSTLNAFVLAAGGLPIAKHGNRAASGRCGSFDLLENLGIPFNFSATKLAEIFRREHLAFFFAQQFFPAMRFFAAVRAKLEQPTIFNLLGPLLNPARPQQQIVGTTSLANARLLVAAARGLQRERFAAVTTENGLDEVTLAGKTFVVELVDQKIREFELDPADFGLPEYCVSEIAGGDLALNTWLARAILTGQSSEGHRDLILANAAFALKFTQKVPDLVTGTQKASQIIQTGLAKQKLATFQRLSPL